MSCLVKYKAYQFGLFSANPPNPTCVAPPGCSDGGAAGDLHPRHDGAGLHGAAEQGPQGFHHGDSGPGEVQGNAHESAEVERLL